MSMNRTASPHSCRFAWLNPWSSRCSNMPRLGSPVSASWNARCWASSASAWVLDRSSRTSARSVFVSASSDSMTTRSAISSVSLMLTWFRSSAAAATFCSTSSFCVMACFMARTGTFSRLRTSFTDVSSLAALSTVSLILSFCLSTRPSEAFLVAAAFFPPLDFMGPPSRDSCIGRPPE